MKIGYARVSSLSQSLERQLDALKREGCEKIFSEKASGKSMLIRPNLSKAIEYLEQDDVLVVAEWDRATRSMYDGMEILKRVAARGATIKALDKPYLDLTDPVKRGIMALLSALAEDERIRINARAREGMRLARQRGVKFGRKYKLTDQQKEEAIRMLNEGKVTQGHIAKLFNVDPSTICRLAKQVARSDNARS